MTQYVSPKELERIRAEEHRIQTCKAQASMACDLLRKQLAEQEMNRRFLAEQGVYFDCGLHYTGSEPYIFSTKQQYEQFKIKKVEEKLKGWLPS
jgi:hypothetical protein